MLDFASVRLYSAHTMSKIKITWYDIFGAFWDVFLMCLRPLAICGIWNFTVAVNDKIPQLNFLQCIGIAAIYNVLFSYIPIEATINESLAKYFKVVRPVDKRVDE